MITACEMNKIRADRLRYNVERQGATRVTVMNLDSRNMDDLFSFDRILLDAPCSGSGTVQLGNPRSKGQFNAKFLEKTTKQQAALLEKALRLLRPGCDFCQPFRIGVSAGVSGSRINRRILHGT